MTDQRKMWIIVGVLAVGLLPARAHAQPVDPAQGRTIDDLVALALAQSPDVVVARFAIAEARGQRQQAAALPNPTISPMWKEQMAGADHEIGIDVEWPLNLFRRHARIGTADQMIDVATVSVQDRERLLAAAVREQAGRVLAAVRTVSVTDELLDLNRGSRDLLEARVREGAAPEIDRNLVEVEVRRLEAERATQAAEAEASLIELKALVGLRPDEDLRLRHDLEQVVGAQAGPAVPATVNAVDETIAARPDVREAAARVKLATARVAELIEEGKSEWSLHASYSRMAFSFPLRALEPATGRFVPIDDVFHYVTVGATIAIPLANRNQGAVAAADATRRGAEQDAKARELSARAELAAARARDREARRAVDLYTAGVRDLSRRNLDVVREAYTLGRTPLFDVFEAQRRYLDIERGYTEALTRAYQARAVLQRASGEVR